MGRPNLRILFVHQNFPGQFLHLTKALAARGHDVAALTDAANTRRSEQKVFRYKFPPKSYDARQSGLSAGIAPKLDRGEMVAKVAAQLKAAMGYEPDVILGTLGWGETLFLKQVWPNAKLLVYAEFMYGVDGLDVNFDAELQPRTLANDLWTTTRQLPLLKAIDAADHAVAPTRWQAGTFPSIYQSRISVIHDGIDSNLIRPRDKAVVQIPGTTLRFHRGDEVLSFVNRNLEPYRGYHVFMRALPKVLAERKSAHVVIVGEDGLSYGTRSPGGKTWKQIFLDEVRDRLDLSRVHFVGRVPYATFIDLMTVTRVHAYLTYPFVLSWSMLEAMAAGALVIGSRTPPVEEVIQDGFNGRLVDFFDVDAWSGALTEALADPDRFAPLRAAARQTICADYDLRSKCLPQLIDLVEKWARGQDSAIDLRGFRP